uniref:Uncharacterized protein n=1 Tax=Panagrolaimus sp. ES5 TaxID=591445 RepID=A0AC34G419_9BILA
MRYLRAGKKGERSVEPQTYNYGQYNQQPQPQAQSLNLNPFQATVNNNFDANSWTQANANLFQQQQQQQLQQQQQQQQSAFNQQQSSYPTQIQPQQQIYSSGENYGPSVQALTGYGGQSPAAASYQQQQQQQQQNVQTYYPFNSADNTYPQPAPTPVVSPQANIYSVPEQQSNQGYGGQPQQPEPVIYQPQPQTQQVVAPQQQSNNYNSYPQFPDPEPEASSQPTIDSTNLQQYAQYLDILQKQYGIKLPAAASGSSPSAVGVPNNVQQQQQQVAAVQNPYAAAVQPQTQSHIQSQIQPGIYPQQNGEQSWNPWQTNAQNTFNSQQQQVKPIVTTYVPQQPSPAAQP